MYFWCSAANQKSLSFFYKCSLILSNKHWVYNLARLCIRCAFLCDIWGQQRELTSVFPLLVNHQFWLTVRSALLLSSSPDAAEPADSAARRTHNGSQIISLHQTLPVAEKKNPLISGQRSSIMQKARCTAKWLVWPGGRTNAPRLVPPDPVCLRCSTIQEGNQSCHVSGNWASEVLNLREEKRFLRAVVFPADAWEMCGFQAGIRRRWISWSGPIVLLHLPLTFSIHTHTHTHADSCLPFSVRARLSFKNVRLVIFTLWGSWQQFW